MQHNRWTNRSIAGARSWALAWLCVAGCDFDTSPLAPDAPSPMPVLEVPGAGASAGTSATDPFANPGQMPVSGAASPTPTAGAAADPQCAEGMTNARPVTPTVWLVVDGSSSMNGGFEAGSTRWQTLRSTLMDPAGVVASLQSVARIGIVIYSGGGFFNDECVDLITVEPALDNYAALDAQYPEDPIGTGTPTDHALEHVVTTLPVANEDVLDAERDPVYVVLATDGSPNDSCGAGFGVDVGQRVVDVTARGTQMGMNMFVISLAGDDTRLQTHLEEVADATASRTSPFVPATRDDLIATFRRIVGDATCLVALDGTVAEGQECRGSVLLNGQPLACDSDNGWRMSDQRTVQLTGTACDLFQSQESQVRATFPCGVLTVD